MLRALPTARLRRCAKLSCGARGRRLGTLVQRGSHARRAKVVVLGSGWGGNKVARDLDKNAYDVQVISPANHFLFTPLLPSTAVGTLEFRAVQEPIRTIDGLGNYYQAKARTLDLARRVLHCEDAFKKRPFQVAFDYLIIATGNKTNTFGVPGVMEREGKRVCLG